MATQSASSSATSTSTDGSSRIDEPPPRRTIPKATSAPQVVDGNDDELKTITRESTPDRRGGFDGPSEPAANVPFEWSGTETRDFDTRVGNRKRLPVESPKHAKRLVEEYASVRLVDAIGLWP